MKPVLHFLDRLRRDEEGLAFIEFAFAAPIFITLVLAGMELTNLAVAHLRVSHMAMTVADNAGRVTSGIDEANIHEVFAGADLIGQPLKFEPNGRVILSSLEENGKNGRDKGQMIRWQRCWGEMEVEPAYGGEGKGKNNDSLKDGMGKDTNRISAGSNTAVMFVEVTYDYQPLVGTGFFDPPTIRYESAFNVRGRQNNAITNTQDVEEFDCD